MKQISKVFFCLLLSCSINAVQAAEFYSFEVDGVYYQILGDRYTSDSVAVVSYYRSESTPHDDGRGWSYTYYDIAKYSGDIVIPSTVTYKGPSYPYEDKVYHVTKIEDYAFYSNNTETNNINYNLRSVTIPSSVKTIGEGVFLHCQALEHVFFSEGIVTIGPRVFEDCIALDSITFPSTITSLGKETFYGCTHLKQVLLPSNITSIPDYMFSCCYDLHTIHVPSTVTTIGIGAFLYCTNLHSFYYGRGEGYGNISIGKGAFSYCEKLYKIFLCTYKVPDGLESAFEKLEGRVTYVASNVGGFDMSAYNQYSDVLGKILPDKMNMDAFNYGDCEYMPTVLSWYNNKYKLDVVDNTYNPLFTSMVLSQEFEIPDYGHSGKIENIKDNAFRDNEYIETAVLPLCNMTIGANAFRGCSNLKSIDVGYTLSDNIGKDTLCVSAFADCHALKTATIRSNIKVLQDSVFANCTSMDTIICYSPIPPICCEDVFYDIDTSTCKLFVPNTALEQYKVANGWKDFLHIQGLSDIPTCIEDVVSKPMLSDIYTVDGLLMKKNVRDFKKLPRGVYIINSRKVLIK